MQIIKALGLSCGVLASAFAPAVAQETCTPGPDALGVFARVAEIDSRRRPPASAFQYKEQGSLADGEVVLTFDDGPFARFAHQARARGPAGAVHQGDLLRRRAHGGGRPEMVREYARFGHTVGIHTWSHANLHSITPLKARMEVEPAGFQRRAAGPGQAGGTVLPVSLSGRQQVHDDASAGAGTLPSSPSTWDSKGLSHPGPGERAHRKVMADLARAKGIILFHDIHALDGAGAAGPAGGPQGQGLYRIVHLQPKAGGDDDAGVRLRSRSRSWTGRRTTVASQPLARRSLTWPVTGVHAERGG